MALGFVFPGQGSQSVGMLNDFANHYPQVKKTFAEASEALGYDLWDLVAKGPADELNRTERTQPAMLTAGVALWRLWRERGGQVPGLIAGHSLGEYTALVCADAVSFTDAVNLVADRGAFMQDAVPEGAGAMAAILGLRDDEVIDLCREAAQGEIVSAANFNSPEQIVVAGHRGAVQRAVQAARQHGAKRAVMLPVSVPSHCELMRRAAEMLAGRLRYMTIASPSIVVIHNVDASSRSKPEEIAKALIEQLYQPVHWVETIQKMLDGGVTRLVECGPGQVLTGLNKRVYRQIQSLPLCNPGSLEQALMHIAES
ncbi:MAG: ACP S-malonyltransferase [Gammaproteobacteria bacterium]|nr:ACP S-malonyltransferase [Gammaproteobacteria bacterium]MCI0590322.1 ACP S-malonyltransferase [Gammaproteobacteria bacterium]